MTPILPEAIEKYCAAHSSGASILAEELECYTYERCEHPQMVTGAWEGALLRMLVALIGAKRVLEIGLFTGYSALTLAEALPEDGEVVSCELKQENAAIASRFFERSPLGKKIQVHVGSALEVLKTLPRQASFDLVFLDADKENYLAYFQACLELLRPGGLIVADNVLWSGRVLDPQQATDRAIAAFNESVRQDERVDVVMLPLRDGVSLIRKR